MQQQDISQDPTTDFREEDDLMPFVLRRPPVVQWGGW